MKIFDRYIIISVIYGVLIALMIIISLFGFFSFLGEISKLNHNFGILQAFKYTMLTLPRRAYELFPTAVLIGSLFSLGNLASHSELISIRAAGVSIGRITYSVLKAGLLLMLVAVLIGEVVAPNLEQKAQSLRSQAERGYITLKGRYGFWARDGEMFINIRRVITKNRIEDVLIYEFGLRRRLSKVVQVEAAEYRDNQWHFTKVKESRLENKSVKISNYDKLVWKKLIDPELLKVLAVKPESLSMLSLTKYVSHLNKHNLESAKYEVAVWIKIFKPMSTLVMLLIAIPFIFKTIRSTNSGQRLLFGILIGLVFFIFNESINNLGVLYGVPAIISAGLPSILFALIGLYAIRRTV